MKKTIAKFLINTAMRLDPDARELIAPVVDGYEAGKIGNKVVFTAKDVKKLCRDWQGSKKLSRRAGKTELIRQAKAQISLLIGRKACDMIEFDVNKGKDIVEVSGHINVYVKNGSKKG